MVITTQIIAKSKTGNLGSRNSAGVPLAFAAL